MNFFEHEMRAMFGDSELLTADTVFTGKTLIGKLDEDIRVKLQFVSTYIHNQYDAITLSIINRKDGLVDKQTFKFEDMIGLKVGGSPHIWENDNKASWYGFRPTEREYEKIIDTISCYMAMYADEGMEYTGQTM